MTVKLDIVSKEMVKPSSSTPHHLRSFKLSFLDQIEPLFYIPLIFFYKACQLHSYEPGRDRLFQLLKQSLSNVLTQFYPLAGNLCGDHLSVDCNDAGVLYIETQVHTDLLHVLHTPNMEELTQYCPPDDQLNTLALLGAVQVNVFTCGGAAIGVKISHIISDGMSLMTFMNAWAANCGGDVDVPMPRLGFDGLFPPKDLASFGPKPFNVIPAEKLSIKRVVFDKETLMRLKHLAASSPESKVKDPTRVEAVFAFILSHFIQAFKPKKISPDPKQMFFAFIAVNIRGMMDPVLSDFSFGNLWAHTITMPSVEEGGSTGYCNLVNDLRNTIRTINSNYVKNMQVGDDHVYKVKKDFELLTSSTMDYCVLSSFCNFGAYEVDFGWGKPTWVCPAAIPVKNTVILMDNNCEGIEAWVNILKEDDATTMQIDRMSVSLNFNLESDSIGL